MSPAPLINVDRLKQLFHELGGEPSILHEIADTFLADLEKCRMELVVAVQTADFEKQKSIAHTIKGSAGTMGADSLQQAADAFEKAVLLAEQDDSTLQGGLENDTLKAIQHTPAELQKALLEVIG